MTSPSYIDQISPISDQTSPIKERLSDEGLSNYKEDLKFIGNFFNKKTPEIKELTKKSIITKSFISPHVSNQPIQGSIKKSRLDFGWRCEICKKNTHLTKDCYSNCKNCKEKNPHNKNKCPYNFKL